MATAKSAPADDQKDSAPQQASLEQILKSGIEQAVQADRQRIANIMTALVVAELEEGDMSAARILLNAYNLIIGGAMTMNQFAENVGCEVDDDLTLLSQLKDEYGRR